MLKKVGSLFLLAINKESFGGFNKQQQDQLTSASTVLNKYG